MKNMEIVKDVFLEMVFIIVNAVVLIYGKLEKDNREYNNVITKLKKGKMSHVSKAAQLLLVNKFEKYIY